MFTVGADPELFLYDPVFNKHIPVIGLIGGTKYNPKKTKHGAVQEDNVMAEFCIKPAKSKKTFSNNVQNVLNDLALLAAPYSFSDKCSVLFDPNELDHPQAQEAGCDPDFDAWLSNEDSLVQNDKPPVTNGTLRTAGGHVHIGFACNGLKDRLDMIRRLDVTLGLPSILMDQDTERRKLYGKAGAFRPKPYGAEYRVLSNFWIFYNETRNWVWNGVEKALLMKDIQEEVDRHSAMIQQAINTSDISLAKDLCYQFDCEVL